MKISFKQIFCILLLLVCLLPLAVFVTAGPSASGANERLAAKPRLTAGGSLNFDVLSDTADYFAGHFGLRQALITANAAAARIAPVPPRVPCGLLAESMPPTRSPFSTPVHSTMESS